MSQKYEKDGTLSINLEQELSVPARPLEFGFWQFYGTFVIKNILDFSGEKSLELDKFLKWIFDGLENSGSDLDSVCKFLENSDPKLELSKFGPQLFEVLIIGRTLGYNTIFCLIMNSYIKVAFCDVLFKQAFANHFQNARTLVIQ